jgi:hypothetical protein
MAMAPKREPTSAEYQQVLDENDALRAEIVKLKWKAIRYADRKKCDCCRNHLVARILGTSDFAA